MTPERKRFLNQRYMRSESGRAKRLQGQRRYAVTKLGKAAAKRAYEKRKADPVKWARTLEASRKWLQANKKAMLEAKHRWLETPNGRRYRRRRQRGLPAWVPDNFIHAFELLDTLKKEKRKWTSTN